MLNTSLPSEPSSPKNRRRGRRLKPKGDDVVTMYTSDGRWPGILVDESETGFGLAVPSSVTVDVGDAVRITAKQTVIKAKVVSYEERKGGVRLGLQVQ